MSRPDLSPAAIEARLTEVERLRRSVRRPSAVDLSEPAITRRLREVSELLRLCSALGSSQPTGTPSSSSSTGSSEPGQTS